MEIILAKCIGDAQAHHWHGLFEQLQGDLEATISTAVLMDHLAEKTGGHEARRRERRTGANCSWKTYQRPTKNHGEWWFKSYKWFYGMILLTYRFHGIWPAWRYKQKRVYPMNHHERSYGIKWEA